MPSNNVYVTDIILNSQQAQNEIKKVKSQADDLRKKLKDATAAHDVPAAKKYGKELDKIERQYQALITRQERIASTLKDISNATPKDLKDTISAINKELNSGRIRRGSEEWKALNKQLREARTELNRIREEGRAQTPIWGRLAEGFNKFGTMAASAVAAVTGLSFTIRKVVNDYAAMEQSMADVRKYTGQTAEEVERMNDDFKRMDTRTSREELNALAGAAGRLGITATSQIEEFVDAADKIGVALGDDLGEGAVDTIGKLAIAFGESDRLGLRGAMLATGSALNEIVQNSSAQAQPVVEFTKALSGVGQQAHMTQAEIMGFASALDQNNQEMATSSTVMSQLITKMYQDPARFANMAGLEVEKFTQTIKTNMNEGLIQWFEAVNKLGDMSVLAGKFDELKMDGTRAVGVLSTLAGHIDAVTEAQRLATQAYEKGTSVIDEFNVQNNTVQASLDKAKKRFTDLSVELGQKLLPIARYAINTASLSVRALKELIDFIEKYAATLISLGVVISAIILKKEADIALDKLKVFWSEKVIATVKRLYTLLASNPWTALAVALAAVIGYLIDMARETSNLKEAVKDANKTINQEVAHLRVLENTLNSSTASEEDRRKALEEINGKLMEAHLGNITEEEVRLGRTKAKLDEYISSLKDKIMLQRLEQALEKSIADEQDANDEIDETSFWRNLTGANDRAIRRRIQAQKDQEKIMKKIDALNSKNAPSSGGTLDEVVVTYHPRKSSGGGGGGTGGGTGGGGSKTDPYQEDLKKLDAAYKRRQLLIKQSLADGLVTEKDYQEQSYAAEMAYLSDKVALQEKYGKETADTQLQMLDKTMQQAKQAQQESAKEMQGELQAAESSYNSDRLLLAQQRNDGLITSDKDYQEQLKQLEMDYAQQRLAILQKFGADTVQAEQAIQDRQLQDTKAFRDEYKKAFEKAYDTADTLQDQRDIAKMMYDAQLIDFEEYQNRMTDIEQQEQEARASIRQQFYQQAMQLLSAASSYAQACSDLEVAKITANYDKQIEAAGNNSRKRERLEKERDEKLRKVKTKNNDRAMKIEIAQALATTATNAISAFGAVLQPQMPWTVPLAYAAAAAATVNGMLQIATIKKQHQAEAAGYYEGGFTGGRRYHREAGVVHEGEFVANHEAVNNPALLPALNLIDQAQRTNTVGRLTSNDLIQSVSPTINTPAPVVNIVGNPDATAALNDLNSVVATLNTILASGIRMDTEQAYRELRRFERLRDNT